MRLAKGYANKTLVVLPLGWASKAIAPPQWRSQYLLNRSSGSTATEGLPTKHSKNSKAEEGDSEFSIVSCV